MVHLYNITINHNAIIGKNCSIFEGATIGFACGKKNGVPIIGDNVQVGINVTVIGKIEIGNDVLIAPNAFVNIDVSSNSVVIGNPCVVVHKDKATKDYVFFRV